MKDFTHEQDPKRDTAQQKQERRNKNNLAQWFHDNDWIPNTLQYDLGEDMFVSIWEGDKSTGTWFLVQHKSKAELTKKDSSKGNALIKIKIHYKDLIHWGKSMIPVFLIVCNVHKIAERYWVSIKSAIDILDKEKPNWREEYRKRKKAQKSEPTVIVNIPRINKLNKAGLAAIRNEVGDHFLPIASALFGPATKIHLAFKNTSLGMAARDEFNQFREAGHSIRIDGNHLERFDLSPWIERLWGRHKPDYIDVKREQTDLLLPFRIEVTQINDSVLAQEIDFKVSSSNSRGGQFEITMTNEHKKRPFCFAAIVQKGHVQFEYRLNYLGVTAFQARESCLFLIALHQAKRLVLFDIEHKLPLVTTMSPQDNAKARAFQECVPILEKLCWIQQNIYKIGNFQVNTFADLIQQRGNIERVYHILKFGKIDIQMRSITGKGTDAEQLMQLYEAAKISEQEMRCRLAIPQPQEEVKLFNVKIPLGRMQLELELGQKETLNFLAQTIAGKPYKISKNADAKFTMVYAEWMNSNISAVE